MPLPMLPTDYLQKEGNTTGKKRKTHKKRKKKLAKSQTKTKLAKTCCFFIRKQNQPLPLVTVRSLFPQFFPGFAPGAGPIQHGQQMLEHMGLRPEIRQAPGEFCFAFFLLE